MGFLSGLGGHLGIGRGAALVVLVVEGAVVDVVDAVSAALILIYKKGAYDVSK